MRLGVMCSGEGTNFENIVHSCPDHEVVLMVYNKKKCGAQKRAERLGINAIRIASKDEDDIIHPAITLQCIQCGSYSDGRVDESGQQEVC